MKKVIALSAALMMLNACGTHSSPAVSNPNALKRTWYLTEMQGFTREQLTAIKAELDLRQLPKASAYMGCNRLMLNADAQNDGKIQFGSVAATRMYCENEMHAEKQFSQTIPSFNQYHVEGHQLILRNPQGQTMRFVAQDWD